MEYNITAREIKIWAAEGHTKALDALLYILKIQTKFTTN